MALVNQFGNPYVYTAAHSAARNTGMRPWEPVELKDIGDLVPAYDRATLVSASRRLYLNQPVLSGAIEQKSMYAIGKAWCPRFIGGDEEYGKEATAWLEQEWFNLCDVRGPSFDFKTSLYANSNAIDRDGESFVVLTETKAGYPQLQHIPSHRVGNPRGITDGPIKEGPYRNARLVDGIVYNRTGYPVAFAFLRNDGTLDKWVSFRDAIHLYDPTWQEQGRGLPAFTPSLNALRDALQSHEWEQMAQLMLSSIGLIEKNETGGPDIGDPSSVLPGTSTSTASETGVTVENFAGGAVRYFRANSGAGLETIKNDRPGDAWESFHDRIIRSALAGVNWPYALVWKPSGQGTAERHDIAKAQRAIEDRQELLKRPAKAIVGWALSKAAKLGIIRNSPDWDQWDFTMPQKLTIDDGRVAKELIEMWRCGPVNHSDILGMMGKTPEEHYRARAAEIRMRKTIAKEFSTDGIEIEDREMAMLTPNEQSEAQVEAAKTSPEKGNGTDSD